MLRQKVIEVFRHRYGRAPALLVRAPGRVNLIGEHTDYNDGFVLPMAIDRHIWAAVGPADDDRVTLFSTDFGQEGSFDLRHLAKGKPLWLEYAKGMAWALKEGSVSLRGFTGVLAGDVPAGAGLSSSAALEMAVARAFAAISGFELDVGTMAQAGRKAENQWIGAQTGIMDQMISAAGVDGHAVLLDCRSLERTPVPLPAGTVVVVLDTATRRGLVSSAYNERHAQCVTGARHFGKPALRDVTTDMLEREGAGLDPATLKRVRHVVTENVRTLAAAEALQRGDAQAFGRLMNESHASLRDDFEVSNAALDVMAAVAQAHPACLGARMTGGGFGGCAVALVRDERREAFVADTAAAYARETNLEPACYVCRAVAGAEVLPL